MSSIYLRTNKNGTQVWRAIIRRKGFRTVCSKFYTKQDAVRWAKKMERLITLVKGKKLLNIQEQETVIKAIKKFKQKKVDMKI